MSNIDKGGNDLDERKVFMVASGIFSGWVCAPKDMSMEDVQSGVDRNVFPSGTSAGWRVEAQDHEEDDLVSPGRCAEDCSRQHWLVRC